MESLLDRVFGPDRRRRTAYAIRGATRPIDALSFALVDQGVLIAAIQCFPVQLAADQGCRVPLIMVGPVAVVPERQGEGHGRFLMTTALAAADTLAADVPLMLIGDPEYYGRFGFTAARTGQWRTPGPVERHRLLARGAGAPDRAGMLGPG